MFREAMFDTGTVSINYAEGPPSGSAVVMLHGISNWWQSFLTVIPLLVIRWHIYAPDFRGHGRSARVRNGYHWEAYADDVTTFLRGRVGKPAYLLGHSLGAMVAIRIAAEAPEVVKALVLEDPPLYGYRGPRLEARPLYKLFVAWRDLAHQGLSTDEIADRLAAVQPDLDAAALRFKARSLSLLDPEVLGMFLDGSAVKNYEIDSLLPRISCPTLLLRGEPALGGAIEDEDERRALALLKRAMAVRVAGAGHFIHPYKPEHYSRAVSNFLESLE